MQPDPTTGPARALAEILFDSTWPKLAGMFAGEVKYRQEVYLRNAQAILDAGWTPPSAAKQEPRWRHKKRGTTYVEVGRATLQHSFDVPLKNGARMVVYEGDQLWVRAVAEFEDGRFELLDGGKP